MTVSEFKRLQGRQARYEFITYTGKIIVGIAYVDHTLNINNPECYIIPQNMLHDYNNGGLRKEQMALLRINPDVIEIAKPIL